MILTDFLIIGSGPSGISAAWPLVKSGKKVLMIDGAPDIEWRSPDTSISEFRKSPDSLRHIYGKDLAGLLRDDDISPKFLTQLARSTLQDGGLPAELTLSNFISTRTGTPGGLTNIWGAFCSSYDNFDLKKYPIKQSDLIKAYITVADRIGISGKNDDLGDFLGDFYPLLKPTELTPPADLLLKNYNSRKKDFSFTLGRARNAVLTEPKSSRNACNNCGLCLYGCSKNSIYCSKFEIFDLLKYTNFTYQNNRQVIKILKSDSNSQIVLLNNGLKIESKKLLLGAGTINSTCLVMDYLGIHDQAVRILSNPCAASAFIFPKLIGSPAPLNSFSLGQLAYKSLLKNNDGYINGVLYGADTLPYELFSKRIPLFSRPVARLISSAITPALILATTYLDSDQSNNILTLKKRFTPDENFQVNLTGRLSDDANNLIKTNNNELRYQLRKLGCLYIPGSLKIAPPGADAHLGGSIPMGGRNKLATTEFGQIRQMGHFYVIDGSVLSSLPPKHPTFTIMANAHRIGEFLAGQ